MSPIVCQQLHSSRSEKTDDSVRLNSNVELMSIRL
jgi:hypothetical protein